MPSPTVTDATIAANQVAAAKLGIKIPGVDGGSSYSTPPTINADSLKNPNAAWQVPTPPSTPNYGAALSAIPSIDSLVGGTIGAASGAQAQKTDLQTRILGVLDKMTGKTAAQQAAESKAGVPDLTKQLTDVTSQITSLQSEANAIPLKVQEDAIGRGETVAGVAPIQTSLLRQNSIKALGLASIASTLQGNLTLAQHQADKAVALEFDPLQSELDYLKEALTLNASDMSEEDKKQATILSAKLQDRQDALTQQKTDRTTVLGYVLQAGQAGAPASLLSKAQTLDPAAAIALLQPYLKDKPISVGSGSSLVDPITGKVIYQGAGGGTKIFTQTQLNNGAANAGLPLTDFGKLDNDTQNYFINTFGGSQLEKDVNAVKSGGLTSSGSNKQEVISNIQGSNVPQTAKAIILQALGVNAASAATDVSGAGGTGGGFWNNIFNFVTSPFGQ